MLQFTLTCALGLVGGVCACPGVGVGPRTPSTPEVRGRLDGGTRAAPGGGEAVPVGGEEVPVFWLGSTEAEDEAELWSLKRDRSFLSKACISSLPAVLVWSSAPSDSTGCGWTWLWLGNEVGRGGWAETGTGWHWEVGCCGAWMDEFIGWEDTTALLKGCCSEAGTVPVPLDVTPVTEETETELLLSWDPGTVGMEVCTDGGEMVEDEGGMIAAGGSCEGAVSWEDWEGGLGSLVTGAGVLDWVDIGGGETLPVEGGGEDVAADERDTAGKVVLVVEGTASGGARILLEFGPSPASVDGTVPASCSVAGGSMVLHLSTRACFILLKACWRVADGADRERPSVIERPRKK